MRVHLSYGENDRFCYNALACSLCNFQNSIQSADILMTELTATITPEPSIKRRDFNECNKKEGNFSPWHVIF